MKRVTVLRGGPSEEYAVSMRSGQSVLESLKGSDYLVRDVVLTRAGEWLDGGVAKSPDQILASSDVIFLALHGAHGEDGTIQRFLHQHRLPYTGSGALASALAFNKIESKTRLREYLKTPKSTVLRGESLWSVANLIDDLYKDSAQEYFLKPVAGGSSHDTYRITDRDALESVLEMALPKHKRLLLEEYIPGREFTVGVLEDFRGERHYAFPPIEIVPAHSEGYYTTRAKYEGKVEYYTPARCTYEEKQLLAAAAITAHQALGCKQYSRSDFILNEDGLHYLETNTLPGLTKDSLLPKAAAVVGVDMRNLIEHLIETAGVQ